MNINYYKQVFYEVVLYPTVNPAVAVLLFPSALKNLDTIKALILSYFCYDRAVIAQSV
jgi:hypothetical protein